MCAACVENGQSLAEKCEAGEPKTTLKGDISDLQAKWEKLEKLFGDLLIKLTEALVQVSLALLLCFVLFAILFTNFDSHKLGSAKVSKISSFQILVLRLSHNSGLIEGVLIEGARYSWCGFNCAYGFFFLQTQEFQGIAKGLERWMEGMNDALHQLERIAARVKLIEPQIEGFGVSNF